MNRQQSATNITMIQNDCTNIDSTNSVHHEMSTHNGIVLEITIEECSCAPTHDARNAMFEPISECSVYGLWRRPRRMAQRVPKSTVSDGGPVAVRRRWPASASYFFLLASASTVASFCFNGDQLLLLAGTHGGPTASPRGLPYNEVAPGVDLTPARVSGEQH